MRFYFTIILIALFLIEVIAQVGLNERHIEFFRKQGLPKCFHLKFTEINTEILNLPVKSISEIYPSANLSITPTSKSKRYAYILLFEKHYIYFGDSLYSTCIVTVEVDSSGAARLHQSASLKYPTTELFYNMAEICNKQIIRLQQAKKLARSYWKDYKFKPKESILKYDIGCDKFFWVLTGYKLLDERIILIDAISGDYIETWEIGY